MTDPGKPSPAGPPPTRLFFIATVVIIMIVGLYIVAPRDSAPPGGVPATAGPVRLQDPIPAEAQVFRTKWGVVAAEPDERARPEARLRSLEFYRRLRAFPGAPPRVPHGLTQEEYRTQRCKVCHERGGYAARFGAYAPVTPHPEFGECLQCHVPEAMSVGVALPDRTGEVVCRQCHVDPDRRPPSLVSLDWVPRPWPVLDTRAMPGGPPVIPHDLQFRGDCLACHAGPAAVRELRTRHPERSNCRQCHVTQESGVQDSLPGATP
jgi:cytochrome c-type protein NapB